MSKLKEEDIDQCFLCGWSMFKYGKETRYNHEHNVSYCIICMVKYGDDIDLKIEEKILNSIRKG